MPEEKLGRSVLELATDDSKLEKGLDVAKEKVGKFGGLAKVAMLGVVGGAIAIGGALLKVGSDFDEAFDTIRAGTGATGEDLEGLKGDFKAVFSAVPTDMKTASTAIADLNTRLGLTGKPLQELSAQFINLARVTGGEVAPLIQTTTRVFGQFNVEGERQGQVLDHLFKVTQSTGISMETLNMQMIKSGPALQEMGFSVEESAALLGQWEKSGVNSKTAIAGLTAAVGVFAKEGKGAREGLADTIAKMQELGPGAESTALALKVFGATAGPALAQEIFKGNFSIDELMGTLEASGETINGVAGDTDDWTQKLDVMKNKLLVAVEPAATKVFDGLGRLIEYVTPLLVELVEWVSVHLPVALDAAGQVIADLQPLWDALGAVVGFLAEYGLPLLGGAFGIVGQAIGGVIGTLRELITWAQRAWDWLSKIVRGVADSPVGGAVGGLLSGLGGAAARFAGGHANGGSFVTDGPTVALFGEGTRSELVSAQPLGSRALQGTSHGHPIHLDGRRVAAALSTPLARERETAWA